MRRLLLISFLLVLFVPHAFAAGAAKSVVKQQKPEKKQVYSIRIDSSKLILHKFNTDSLTKYRNTPEFTYKENTKAGVSFWERFWRWFWNWIESLFPKSSMPGPSLSTIRILEYVIAFTALGVVIFIILKIAGLNLSNIFNRKSKDIDLPYYESLENIHQITFDEEIEKALSQRNYRLAVRLLYLRTLKNLNDADLINWQIDKTNSVYLNELKDMNLRRSFATLTRQFEYIWYGNFPVDSSSYKQINSLFHNFKITVK